MKIFSKKKQIHVNITNLGNYINYEFEYANSNTGVMPKIYNNLLHFFLKDLQQIYISQFFDEDQGLFVPKDQLKKIQEEFHLQLNVTKNFSEYDDTGKYTNSYIINLAGKPDPYWLDNITFWGGACLSNIIFGFNDKKLIGEDEIISLNYRFSTSYWFMSTYEKIASLRDESAILCWTSHSNLNMMIDSSLNTSLLDYIKELTKQFSIKFAMQTGK